jgi:UDP-galactopyranose mutase
MESQLVKTDGTPNLTSYDYVIVGAGLYGAIFAYEAKKRGHTCLVIDSRNHIGGNCFTENVSGVNVHVYGPHIFHTNSEEIWNYVNQFAKFNNFVYRPKVKAPDGKMYSFPINLMTLYQVYGTDTPDAAKIAVSKDVVPPVNDNLEDWAISQVGKKLYDLFIRGYTSKQWKKNPKELPSSIIKRLPVRYTYDDNYFNDKFQGIPCGGYTAIFERLLEGTEVLLSRPYREGDEALARRKVIFTGPIDAFFGYRFGKLEYRSLRFETDVRQGDVQGNAVINYTGDEPYTRIIEHKHFENPSNPTTVVTKEYPDDWDTTKTPYYPINTKDNQELYRKYRDLAAQYPKIHFGGRLGTYQYYDMHQVVGQVLKDVKVEFGEI